MAVTVVIRQVREQITCQLRILRCRLGFITVGDRICRRRNCDINIRTCLSVITVTNSIGNVFRQGTVIVVGRYEGKTSVCIDSQRTFG